jgi:hypothetical protein
LIYKMWRIGLSQEWCIGQSKKVWIELIKVKTLRISSKLHPVTHLLIVEKLVCLLSLKSYPAYSSVSGSVGLGID